MKKLPKFNRTNIIVIFVSILLLQSTVMFFCERADLILSFLLEFFIVLFSIIFLPQDLLRRLVWSFYFCILGIQTASIFSTGQYLVPLALSNAAEFAALGMSSFIKTAAVFIFYVFLSFLIFPGRIGSVRNNKQVVIFLIGTLLLYFSRGPLHEFFVTGKLYYMQATFKPNAKIAESGKEFLKNIIYNDASNDAFDFKKRNVIVIFTEGMSQEVIGRANGRDFSITPNIDNYLKEGTSFSNYYNHTAATFRGLRGQLTSGYQYRDGVTNEGTGIDQLSSHDINDIYLNRQVTLPEILRAEGYKSYFIASTHKDSPLNTMLKTLNFDNVLGMGNFVGYQHDRMTDKQTFNALRDFLNSAPQGERPFFIGVYPSGTHHGQDSPNAKYGDGSNPYYNKFYNFDQQLGHFVEYFKKSKYYNNSILIITADHATYPSPEYKKSFNSKAAYFVNKIPFILIGKGVKHQVINVHGVNSLSLAPTILQMLGVKYSMNYFLGCSLIDKGCSSPLSKASAIGDDFFITGEGDDDGVTLLPFTDAGPVKSEIKRFYNISG